MIIIILTIIVVLGLGIWNYVLLTQLNKLKSSIVELRDSKPTKSTKTSKSMKLSNELEPYIHEVGDEVVIKVVQW